MTRFHTGIKLLFLLLLPSLAILAAPLAHGQQKGPGDTAGITWKQARLSPDWHIEIPAHWEREKELAPVTFGAYRYGEANEFISLSLLPGNDELVTEAVRTSATGRSLEIIAP